MEGGASQRRGFAETGVKVGRREDGETPVPPTGSGHRWLLPATVIAVVVLVTAAILRVPPEVAQYSRVAVAVFPFEQPAEARDRFPVDLSTEIAAKLRGAPGIVTISGDRGDLEAMGGWLELASALAADFALVGTIQPDSAVDGVGRWLVIPHVVRVVDAGRQWSGRYVIGLDSTDLVDVQARIAEDVAKAVRLAFGPG